MVLELCQVNDIRIGKYFSFLQFELFAANQSGYSRRVLDGENLDHADNSISSSFAGSRIARMLCQASKLATDQFDCSRLLDLLDAIFAINNFSEATSAI